MPELHSLTPALGVQLDKGFKVALVTDGRMSGASGKVPAAIHVTPEAAGGGPLAYVKTGDLIRLDAREGTLTVKAEDLMTREPARSTASRGGYGRDLFGNFRAVASQADEG